MLLNSDAKGVCVIAPTPFLDDGAIDSLSIDRMTDFFVEAGARCVDPLDGRPAQRAIGHARQVAQKVFGD